MSLAKFSALGLKTQSGKIHIIPPSWVILWQPGVGYTVWGPQGCDVW